jgi:hypothetical protein
VSFGVRCKKVWRRPKHRRFITLDGDAFERNYPLRSSKDIYDASIGELELLVARRFNRRAYLDLESSKNIGAHVDWKALCDIYHCARPNHPGGGPIIRLRNSLDAAGYVPITGMSKKWLIIALLATTAIGASIGDANAKDPRSLGMESGERIAAILMSRGFLCLRATTLKRTIVRLNGERTFRVACGRDGGPPIYFITMPAGQHLRVMPSP